jgi:hypothetical protein
VQRADSRTDPVGPTTRLMHPGLKSSSPSILSMNLRLEGVSVPSTFSLDHAKVASRNPISVAAVSAGMKRSGVSGSFSAKESRSSVLKSH